MSEELEQLSRRLVGCKGWRWLPGMLAWRKTHRGERVPVRLVSGVSYAAELLDPHVIESTPEGKLIAASAHAVVDGWHRVEDLIPDLADPATLGCLLALVREAWVDPTASTAATREANGGRGWVMDCWDPKSPLNGIGPFQSEAEALVFALEAAP